MVVDGGRVGAPTVSETPDATTAEDVVPRVRVVAVHTGCLRVVLAPLPVVMAVDGTVERDGDPAFLAVTGPPPALARHPVDAVTPVVARRPPLGRLGDV